MGSSCALPKNSLAFHKNQTMYRSVASLFHLLILQSILVLPLILSLPGIFISLNNLINVKKSCICFKKVSKMPGTVVSEEVSWWNVTFTVNLSFTSFFFWNKITYFLFFKPSWFGVFCRKEVSSKSLARSKNLAVERKIKKYFLVLNF